MRIRNIDARRAAVLTAVVGVLIAIAWAVSGGTSAEAGTAFLGSDVEIGEELPLLEAHPYTDGPSTLAAARKSKPSIKQYVTDELTVEANGSQAGSMKCPRRTKVIDGGFLTSGGIISDTLGPVSSNKFGFSAFDITGTDGAVVFIITCSKGNG